MTTKVPTAVGVASGLASGSTAKSSKSNLGPARRKLEAALRAIDDPHAILLQVRKAHQMAAGASTLLEQQLAAIAAANAALQRSNAAALARGLRDARGRKRTAVTMPGYHKGRTPASKGKRYDPTPPTVNEVLRMLALAPTMRLVERGECPSCHQTWRQPHSQECVNAWAERLKALIYLLWRGGLRIGCEALRLTENDLHPAEGYVYVAHGKNDKSREVVIDDWVWPLLQPWLEFRQALPPGPLFCTMDGPTAGVRPWSGPNIRLNLHALARRAGIRHRVAPHQFRHAMAVEQLEEGVNPLYISRNMGHASLQVTDNYFKGLPQSRVVQELRGRPIPRVSMFDVLRGEGSRVSDRAHRPSTPDLMGALSRA